MVNPFRDIDWHPDRAARRRFGRSLLLGFPLLGLILTGLSRLAGDGWVAWPLWLALGGSLAGGLCWIAPGLARPLYVAWYAIGASLGLVVSNGLLIASYLLTVVPIGLVLRLCGRDPMKRRFDRGARTYWRPVEERIDPARYFRQF